MYFSGAQCWALRKSSLNDWGRGKESGKGRERKTLRKQQVPANSSVWLLSSSLLQHVPRSPLAGNLGACASPRNRAGIRRAVEAVMKLWAWEQHGGLSLWLLCCHSLHHHSLLSSSRRRLNPGSHKVNRCS